MSTTTTSSVLLDAGHDYISRGWRVLACKPKSKDPYFPLAPKAYLSATDSHYDLDDWFDRKPTINLGIAAYQSGLIIVDLDHRTFDAKAHDTEARLFQDHATFTVKTGDGWHLYYTDPGDITHVPGKLIDGVETKWKGYVVAAPSTHPTGVQYQVTHDTDPAPFPRWLLTLRSSR